MLPPPHPVTAAVAPHNTATKLGVPFRSHTGWRSAHAHRWLRNTIEFGINATVTAYSGTAAVLQVHHHPHGCGTRPYPPPPAPTPVTPRAVKLAAKASALAAQLLDGPCTTTAAASGTSLAKLCGLVAEPAFRAMPGVEALGAAGLLLQEAAVAGAGSVVVDIAARTLATVAHEAPRNTAVLHALARARLLQGSPNRAAEAWLQAWRLNTTLCSSDDSTTSGVTARFTEWQRGQLQALQHPSAAAYMVRGCLAPSVGKAMANGLRVSPRTASTLFEALSLSSIWQPAGDTTTTTTDALQARLRHGLACGMLLQLAEEARATLLGEAWVLEDVVATLVMEPPGSTEGTSSVVNMPGSAQHSIHVLLYSPRHHHDRHDRPVSVQLHHEHCDPQCATHVQDSSVVGLQGWPTGVTFTSLQSSRSSTSAQPSPMLLSFAFTRLRERRGSIQ